MDHFLYRDNELYAEDVPVRAIATTYGTPCYVYSRATLERHWRVFDHACNKRTHLICFAVKANSNLAVLNVLARLGSGFDVVSVGELERVLAAGGDASRIVFSGVGKRVDELQRALAIGIRCFNVESSTELVRLNSIATTFNVRAPIALRINPNVDALTHPYISTGLKENKFGIDISEALALYQQAASFNHIEIIGIACHIGSQLIQTTPFLDALDRMLQLAQELHANNIHIRHLDLGGGLGIRYTHETPTTPEEHVAALEKRLDGLPYELLLEPGRAIAGNAGILLAKVEYLKETPYKRFAILDAAMNDLLRPALYKAEQSIIPARLDTTAPNQVWDIVGPICETGDFLGTHRHLALQTGDLLAIRGSGAYGFTMSSNYNSRPRVAEIMVDQDRMHLVRRRETIADIMAGESTLEMPP